MTVRTPPRPEVVELEREARLRVGDQTTPVRFRPALERLVESINTEARLHPAGLAAARSALVRAVQNQLLLAAWQRENAQRAAPPPPVAVITGLHRTGSTLLQEMLAAHPEIRAPRLWELLAPAARSCPHRLVESARRYVEEYHRAAPGFAAIHHLHPERPEECHRLLGNSFLSEIYGLRYRVPGYLDWLAGQDHTAAYGLHREQLRAILTRPAGATAVLLKCPFHLWHPEELAATYPGARVIRLHRDPVAALGSACSLTRTIRTARSDRVDTAEIGEFWLRRAAAATGKLARTGADACAGLPVLDLRYPDLVADPVRAARDVVAFLGLGWDAGTERRLRRAAGARGPAQPGRHRYDLRDYGLDPGRTGRAFADYRALYHL
jgi:hypothetical protein